ncbi:aminodeoxychorismate synthase component I [Ruixingdingia sedimenti]|uniref:Aminodeoxychorismate synthase component I n=1 Tax=Ruixingdingia sedimenti TaxID=3073604 RepID=A0ABU1F6F8_9RHOB|nr:aminodeoxychorismate synthase component I [Xinfangfangia sp. LG-4]MDR5652459.1 aminodeoxychorismate synthase component I [Xinfangfangia sp. LG-4]
MILIENGPGGAPALFDTPRRVIRADAPGDLPGALAAVEDALARGLWVAGYLSYEAGLLWEPRLAPLLPGVRAVPLALFGVYDAPLPAPRLDAGGATLSVPEPLVRRADHAAAMARVLDYIRAGDIYQVNLTFPMQARYAGAPAALYAALRARQPVPHGALVALPDAPAVVSMSPELFFALDGGQITVRPMKGTRPRAASPAADAALAAELAASTKDRAENLMIVDLMRNDISRFCRVGSVRVPELFAVETYATVHQMVSTVTGQVVPGTGLAAILRAIFPCGSITGAPKIRAMEVIHELEPAPRGVYCGAVGWAGPGGRAAFNVAIRTLTLFPGGRAVLNVGGGVVADSTAEGEYDEALWKARFAVLG